MSPVTRPAALMLAAAVAAGCADRGPTGPEGSAAESRLRHLTLIQSDRFGLPAIATVFIPTAQKDAYNQAVPAGDRQAFRAFVVARLVAFGHPDPDALADALLPDVQPANLGQPSGFLNGRRLFDDVITAELGLIFGANDDLNDDHVDANDRPFLAGFPYLAAPHLP